MDDTLPPIACRLSPAALTDRESAWRGVLRDGLLRREARPGGLRLVLMPSVDARVRALLELEAECCPWFTSSVRDEAGQLVVDLVASGEGAAVLAAMFDGIAAPGTHH